MLFLMKSAMRKPWEKKVRFLKCDEKAMEIWFFLHINIIQDSFENRSRGWYARKSLSVWKSYEKPKETHGHNKRRKR